MLGQLVEWWEDLSRGEINSRAVLLPVPSGWGRTYLLNQFAAIVDHDEAISLMVSVAGASLPDGLGLQAQVLQERFSKARVSKVDADDLDPEVKLPTKSSAANVLGIDQLGGMAQLSLGVGSLFVSQFAALVVMLIAGIGAGAAEKVWDDSPAGKEGAVARLARAVAATSVSVPVVVTIDDCDELEPSLAATLIENLIERVDGQVLVVAAANPDGDLLRDLFSQVKYGLTGGRVRTVEVDPDMSYQSRVDLAAQVCPNLPTVAVCRIAQRTRTFVEVFAVAAAERLTEVDAHGDAAAIVTVVDEVIDAHVNRAPPSSLAVMLAWAGGTLHVRQAQRADPVLSAGPVDGNVIRVESLLRLADPDAPRLIEQVRVLAAGKRQQLAEIVLDTALEICRDPKAGLVDKVVACRAAHRVRADLQNRTLLASVQCQLVHGLEALGDLAASYQVARTALADLYLGGHPGDQDRRERDELSAAVLRLAHMLQQRHNDPLIDTAVAAAAAGGATVGLEARMWAAIDLLGQSDQRERALELVGQLVVDLSQRNDLGAIGDRWRLQLAFHVGRAGYRDVARQLLATMLSATGSAEADAARAVWRAVGGSRAETRLQIAGLEAELATLPSDADDDRLRIHHTLAADYGNVGDCRSALYHSTQELALHCRIHGPDHPYTLTTRSNIADWTGLSGQPAEALRLFQELLPDRQRILGSDHADTLSTRSLIAYWTGLSGHATRALQLYQELLKDEERILGCYHSETLGTRGNEALWIGLCGDPARALEQFKELLPHQGRIMGPDHPNTLTIRANIADWTERCGRPVEALQLYSELLPDKERVLGSDHPDTLTIRVKIATCTGGCGRVEQALGLSTELLPDLERILGPDHPDTLTTRGTIAFWTGRCGYPEKALQLSTELLPDRERVLGYGHPDTLATREQIASLTRQCGHPEEALQLYKELLPDYEWVLGPDHPDILAIRALIADLAGQCGHPEETLRLFKELLPDLERIFGPDNPSTLRSRGLIASLSGQHGDPEEALQLYKSLLPSQERVLGYDHPDTLATREHIASLTGQCGHREEALQLYKELLPDQERVLGPHNPDTLGSRGVIASLTGQFGHPEEALRLFKELLPDLERIFGPDNTGTLGCRGVIATLAAQCGHREDALRHFEELLPDEERILGPDHPSTLTTRRHIQELK